MHLELSHCRCHSQLSRSCVPNLSCNHLNQSCSSTGKITLALFCLLRQNRHYLTLAEPLSNMPMCYRRICNFAESRQSRSWIFLWFAEEELMRSKTFWSRSGCGVKKIRIHPSLISTKKGCIHTYENNKSFHYVKLANASHNNVSSSRKGCVSQNIFIHVRHIAFILFHTLSMCLAYVPM